MVRLAHSADLRSRLRHVSSAASIACSMRCSRVVTHPGTNPARRCLMRLVLDLRQTTQYKSGFEVGSVLPPLKKSPFELETFRTTSKLFSVLNSKAKLHWLFRSIPLYLDFHAVVSLFSVCCKLLHGRLLMYMLIYMLLVNLWHCLMTWVFSALRQLALVTQWTFSLPCFVLILNPPMKPLHKCGLFVCLF